MKVYMVLEERVAYFFRQATPDSTDSVESYYLWVVGPNGASEYEGKFLATSRLMAGLLEQAKPFNAQKFEAHVDTLMVRRTSPDE